MGGPKLFCYSEIRGCWHRITRLLGMMGNATFSVVINVKFLMSLRVDVACTTLYRCIWQVERRGRCPDGVCRSDSPTEHSLEGTRATLDSGSIGSGKQAEMFENAKKSSLVNSDQAMCLLDMLQLPRNHWSRYKCDEKGYGELSGGRRAKER